MAATHTCCNLAPFSILPHTIELKLVPEVDICSEACLGNQWLSCSLIIAEEGSTSPICPP